MFRQGLGGKKSGPDICRGENSVIYGTQKTKEKEDSKLSLTRLLWETGEGRAPQQVFLRG